MFARPGSRSTCTLLSSICTTGPARIQSSRISSNGINSRATASIQSAIVRRDSSTPSRANCFSCRYSGSASQKRRPLLVPGAFAVVTRVPRAHRADHL